MIGHQHVGVKTALVARERVAEQIEVGAAIVVGKEAGQAVVAALDEVLRDVGQVGAGQARHRSTLPASGCSDHRGAARPAVGNLHTGAYESVSDTVFRTPFSDTVLRDTVFRVASAQRLAHSGAFPAHQRRGKPCLD